VNSTGADESIRFGAGRHPKLRERAIDAHQASMPACLSHAAIMSWHG
jgi:hypothetical protein